MKLKRGRGGVSVSPGSATTCLPGCRKNGVARVGAVFASTGDGSRCHVNTVCSSSSKRAFFNKKSCGGWGPRQKPPSAPLHPLLQSTLVWRRGIFHCIDERPGRIIAPSRGKDAQAKPRVLPKSAVLHGQPAFKRLSPSRKFRQEVQSSAAKSSHSTVRRAQPHDQQPALPAAALSGACRCWPRWVERLGGRKRCICSRCARVVPRCVAGDPGSISRLEGRLL